MVRVKRLLTTKELMEYLGVGMTAARKFGYASDADVRLGGSLRWDVFRINAAIEEMKRAPESTEAVVDLEAVNFILPTV